MEALTKEKCKADIKVWQYILCQARSNQKFYQRMATNLRSSVYQNRADSYTNTINSAIDAIRSTRRMLKQL